jgi:hypothetical protein
MRPASVDATLPTELQLRRVEFQFVARTKRRQKQPSMFGSQRLHAVTAAILGVSSQQGFVRHCGISSASPSRRRQRDRLAAATR